MKWGILATGTIAKKFASTVEQMGAEGEQLVAVGSRHLESAQAFAQQYGIPRCYDSYEALAADPEVEAIYNRHPQHPALRKLQALLGAGQARFVRKALYHPPGAGAAAVPSGGGKAPLSHGGVLDLAAAAVRPPAPDPCGWHHRGAEADHLSVRLCASGARKNRKFDSGLGGGALLDIGIYNLGFLRILTGQDPEKVETKEVHINEYGTDDYSCLVLTYPGGCKAESVQTIGQELERNARIVGTKGSIFLPDFQHAETMTLEVEGKEPEVIRCPVDINGFEYEIREASRCVKLGRTGSDRYTPQDSLALTRLMYDTRMSWGMKFAGEV